MKAKYLKSILAAALSILLIVSLVACANNGGGSGSSGTTTIEHDGPIGSGAVKWDPGVQVNNGDDIELEYWFWFGEEFFQDVIDGYNQYRPNVTITLVNQPWGEMWTLLPLAMNAGGGPPLFNVHNSQNAILAPFIEPLTIPISDLEADFVNVSAHIQEGNILYIDFGLMSSGIFYNKEHWADAGLTSADYPKTWDELAEVAVKLTEYSGDQMIRSGINLNGANVLLTAINYQSGSRMFRDGGVANFDNQYTINSIQRLMDFYDVHEVTHRDFGIDANESFGVGQSSMVYNWGWFFGYMQSTFPDIDFGVFPLPTIDNSTPFAIDRFNGESTPGINKNATDAEKEVGQDFLRYLLASDDHLVDLNLAFGVFPSKRSIQNNAQILAVPHLQVTAETIDRLIWPGPYPAPYDDILGTMWEEVKYLRTPIAEAVSAAQARMDIELAPHEFVSREPQYQFYSEHVN